MKKTGTKSRRASKPPTTDPEPRWFRLTEKRGALFAAVCLALLLLVFFSPLFFGGKTFRSADHLVYAAHRPFLEECAREPGSWFDRFPLWNPYVFSGMPAYASMLIGPLITPPNVLLAFLPEIPRMVLFYLVLGFCFWLLARRFELGTWTSLLGATVFLFSTQVITMVMFGQHVKLTTLMLVPIVLLASQALWQRPTMTRALLLAPAVGLMLLCGHFQVAAYAVMAAALFNLVSTLANRREGAGWGWAGRRWILWLGAMAVGLVLASSLVLPVREYSASSIRGGEGGGVSYEYATEWSLHPAELLTLVAPGSFGYGNATYWGWMPFTDYPFYFGILPLLLAAMAVVLWPRERANLQLACVFAVAVLIALGRYLPIYRALFEFIPFFDKFRAPSMIMLLAGIAIALLAARATDRVAAVKPGPEAGRVFRVFVRAGATIAVLLAAATVAAGTGLLQPRIEAKMLAKARLNHELDSLQPGAPLPPEIIAAAKANAAQSGMLAAKDGGITLLILGVGVALIALRLRGKLSRSGFLLALLLVVIVDLWRVGSKPAEYVPSRTLPAAFQPSPVVDFLRADREPHRILPLLSEEVTNNWAAWFRLPSVLGYHPAKLGLYDELLGYEGPVGLRPMLLAGNTHLLDMLNVRYLVTGHDFPIGGFDPVHRSTYSVFRNPSACPRLWFVDRVRVIADPSAHLLELANPAWNPRDEALVFSDLGTVDSGRGGQAALTRYGPRRIEATLESPGTCFLVVSEIYYQPGWKAWLDEREVPIHRTNHVLRGIVVPPGQHALSMRFDPPAFRKGMTVSAAGFGLVAVGLATTFLTGRRRRRASIEDIRADDRERP